MMTSFRRKLAAVATAFAAVAIVVAGASAQEGSKKPEGKPVVIGVGAPMTGRSAAFGTQVRYGVELAAKELNEKGGILGRPVQVIVKDDASNANEASIVAQSFAGNPDVVAVVGHFNSDCSSAAKKIYTSANLVMLSPASTNVEITKGSDFIFRNIFQDQQQGFGLADYAAKSLKAKRIAVIYENDTYGKGLRDNVLARAKELGLEVTNDISYETDTTDFRPLLQPIKSSNPEVLVTAGLYKAGGTIARQAREMGVRARLLGGDGMFEEELAKIGGKAAEGYLASTPFLMDANDRSKKMAQDIKKEFGEEGNAWAALAYDALMLIATSAENQKSVDRKAIRDGLAAINSPENAFPGVTGKTYFDAEGDCLKNVMFAVVKGGKFVTAPEQLPE